MLKKKPQLLLLFFLLIFFIILLVFGFLSFSKIINDQIAGSKDEKPAQKNTPSTTPTRGYKLGISGFTPANFPDYSKSEQKVFWSELNNYSDVYGVHVDWQNNGLIAITSKNYKHEIAVVLGYQDPDSWGNDKDDFIKVADKLVTDNPQVTHIGIGNEVNLLFEKNPEKFEKFIEDYKYFYDKLKAKHPNLQIYTTFNYESLIGKGKLFGASIDHNDNTSLINRFDDKLDRIAITLYPHFDYKEPEKIPEDYLESLVKYEKPISITETGWISREEFGGKYAILDKEGYAGSEEEQMAYLTWLKSLKNNYDIDFINWIFLNDPISWENGIVTNQSFVLFDSIGLKKNDGVEKQVWDEWKKEFE